MSATVVLISMAAGAMLPYSKQLVDAAYADISSQQSSVVVQLFEAAKADDVVKFKSLLIDGAPFRGLGRSKEVRIRDIARLQQCAVTAPYLIGNDKVVGYYHCEGGYLSTENSTTFRFVGLKISSIASVSVAKRGLR